MLLVLVACLIPWGGIQFVQAQSSPWLVNAINREPVWGQDYRSIVGLATDPVSGELYILDAGRRLVDVMDSIGVVRFSFGHWFTDPKTGERQQGEPNSLVVSATGDIFITDFFSNRVDVLNIRGEVIGQIDVLAALGWDQATCRPEKVAVAGSEWLYVSIGGERSGIARCRLDGSECALFVDAATEKLDCIGALSVSADGRVAVTDYRGEPAVRIYDSQGQLALGFGRHDTDEGDLSFPSAFLFADDGTFWVVDALRQVVKHYAANGEFLEYIGGFGAAPGNLRYPSAISGDGVSQLFVAERVGRRVQEYILPAALATPPAHDSTAAGAVATTPDVDNGRNYKR